MEDYKIYTADKITGRITMIPPSPPKKVSGLEKLVQIVLMGIYNNPGRSAMHPEQGSGIASLINSNISVEDPMEVLAAISERIEKIKDEILENQGELENEDPSERLRDLIVRNVETGVNIDEVIVKFKVVSEAGDEANLVV